MKIVDPKLQQQLENSPCFSLAHDPTVKECRMCDLQQECAAKTKANSVFSDLKQLSDETSEALNAKKEGKSNVVSFPSKDTQQTKSDENKTPDEITDNKKVNKKKKKKKENPIGMPDTKNLSVEKLWELVTERNGKCKQFSNPAIQKMRLIMALKETYK